MRTVITLTILFISQIATGENRVKLDDSISAGIEQGRLTIHRKTKTVWSKSIADPKKEIATETLVAHSVSNHTALHATISFKSGKRKETVFLVKTGQTTGRMIFNEETQLKGDLGERTGHAIQFEDLDGDGLPEIVAGDIFEAVKLCGDTAPALLFRRAFDFKSRKFRPILAKRISPAQPVEITSKTRLATDEETHPLLGIFAQSASRTADDQGSPLFLSKPRSTTDRNPDTWWSPWPGNGAGEFVSFRTSTSTYGIDMIGILPHVGTLKKKRFDRPKSLLLKTDSTTYRLLFENDAKQNPNQIYWFSFPSPIHTACLSLIVESSMEPTLKTPLGVAEVMVKTELDGPNGPDKLASDLTNPDRRRQASLLLGRLGKQAVPPIRKVWPKLDPAGQRLAIEVIGETDPENATDILVDAALSSSTPETRESALNHLKKSPQKAIAELSTHFKEASPQLFDKIVGAISFIGTPNGLNALAELAGQGSRLRRSHLKTALRRFAARTLESQNQLWSQIESAHNNQMWEKCIDLLQVAVLTPALHEKIFQFVDDVFVSHPSFRDQYRLLAILGQLSCEFSRARLIASADASDLQIRAISLQGIGPCAQKGAKNVLKKGLASPEPPVKLAALSTLRQNGLAETMAVDIAKIADVDPWPEVRAAAVLAADRLPPKLRLPILEKTIQDKSPSVRQIALQGALQLEGPRADRIIETRLTAKGEAVPIRLLAITAVGKRCQESALTPLNDILTVGREPLAPFEHVESAVAAARAMGKIGSDAARKMLEAAKRRSNPATDKAIDAALKMKSSCQSEKQSTPN